MALKIMDYFSKQMITLVCNACPKSYALATAKSSHSSLWYYLRIIITTFVRPYIASTAATTKTTGAEPITTTAELFLHCTYKATRQPQESRNLYKGGRPICDSRRRVDLDPANSSVVAERVFSASGFYLTKLKCRLSDNRIDMLVLPDQVEVPTQQQQL